MILVAGKTAMANESKVTELFSMADGFGKFFDAIRAFSANATTNGKTHVHVFKKRVHVFKKHLDVLAGRRGRGYTHTKTAPSIR